jgi:hypothetical protein
MTSDVGLGSRHGLMALYSRDSTRTTKRMAKGNSDGLMATSILGSSKRTRRLDRAS